jgi:glycerol-1-phosphate dehydrogenase [NAD(P)+]
MSRAADAARDLDGLRRRLAAAPDGGALRPVGLRRVLLGEGALAAVGPLVRELRGARGPAVVLADATPMRGAGSELKAALRAALEREDGGVRHVRVGGDDGRPHADEATLEAATAGASGAGVLVSVGSGTLTDIAKAVSARLGGVPHVAVQTAASVNGYADDQSVLLRHGVKRTTPTRWPDALVIDTGVLRAAPAPLNRAGLGDLLATFTAPADWRLAELVGQDGSYAPTVVALTREHGEALLGLGPGVAGAQGEALEALAGLLTLSGISMGVAGRTAPGSGMEHTVSHLLEMAEVAPRALHGAQVGVCSVLAALLWRRVRARLRAQGASALRFPTAEEMAPRVRAAFADLDPSGATGEECWADYARKLERWHAERGRAIAVADAWAEHDPELGALVAEPAALVRALREAAAPVRFSELGVPPDAARWALAHCHLMRDRFTVADLAAFLDAWDAASVDALLEEAAALGAGL